MVRDYATLEDELRHYFYDTPLVLDAADAIAELVERETPKKLRTTVSTKRCPSCNKQVSGIGNSHKNYNYCRWCGQALDWN